MSSNWSYSPETANLGQNRLFFEPRDLEIWHMILKNNRASFHHMWIQIGEPLHHHRDPVHVSNSSGRMDAARNVLLRLWYRHLSARENVWTLHTGTINGNDISTKFSSLAPEVVKLQTFLSLASPEDVYGDKFRCSHWWVQTGVTVRKRQIWVKIDDFF